MSSGFWVHYKQSRLGTRSLSQCTLIRFWHAFPNLNLQLCWKAALLSETTFPRNRRQHWLRNSKPRFKKAKRSEIPLIRRFIILDHRQLMCATDSELFCEAKGGQRKAILFEGGGRKKWTSCFKSWDFCGISRGFLSPSRRVSSALARIELKPTTSIGSAFHWLENWPGLKCMKRTTSKRKRTVRKYFRIRIWQAHWLPRPIFVHSIQVLGFYAIQNIAFPICHPQLCCVVY
mmetsp:Transcript_27234/g.53539  ORF Transcript_27234/g.53539 Transcript_27234/m.53539 type:complete len:232 (-) Transcript_27234:19-714(-)